MIRERQVLSSVHVEIDILLHTRLAEELLVYYLFFWQEHSHQAITHLGTSLMCLSKVTGEHDPLLWMFVEFLELGEHWDL